MQASFNGAVYTCLECRWRWAMNLVPWEMGCWWRGGNRWWPSYNWRQARCGWSKRRRSGYYGRQTRCWWRWAVNLVAWQMRCWGCGSSRWWPCYNWRQARCRW
uniref:Uncharacterized protein n=1 Tax=Opuntia streptacantha TaxID=393608 RepID=A0A7C8YQF0_OPUST